MLTLVLLAKLGFIVILGSIMGFWMRRFEMQGFELWLPMSIIIAYAISPLTGFIVAMLMVIISFMLHPFNLPNCAVMTICLAGIVAGTALFPVTEENFARIGMLFVLAYIAVSTVLTSILGYPLIRNAKFILLAIFFNYLLFTQVGWKILLWFQG